MNTTSKNPETAALIASVTKQYGHGAIMTLEDGQPAHETSVLPTGSLAVDVATRIGGYPRGRVVELYGPQGGGKRTLALSAIAREQKMGGVCAFVDAEHTLDVQYAKAIGVDPSKLLISQPDTGEQAMDIVEMLTRSGAVTLIVLDSMGALTPSSQIAGEDVYDQHGTHCRLMSQALRKITAAAYRTGTTILCINRLPNVQRHPFAGPLAPGAAGTNALKFYSSMRLDVRAKGPAFFNEAEVGIHCQVKVAKNKCAAPFTTADFTILASVGIDDVGELLDVGAELGVVTRTRTPPDPPAGGYAFSDTYLGNTRERACDTLRRDDDVRETVLTSVLSEIHNPTRQP